MQHQRWIACFLFATLIPWSFVSARTTNDPLANNQWYLGQVRAGEAWETTTGQGVIVAVLDTAMDMQHEDLAGNIFVNTGEVVGDGIDNDGNGFVDDVHGWDFYHGDNDPSTTDLTASATAGAHHATIVAGVIGAVGNNGIGITGINWRVRILPVQVLTADGDGSIGDIIRGINYAVDMGADVINLSFVGNQNTVALNTALQRAYDAGVIVVTAMGNENQNLDQQPLYPVCSPGLGADNVTLGVVATDSQDRRASFSNYGKTCADIAAPGVDVFTTQVSTLASAYGGGWGGTSLAAPILSGAAALARSVYPRITPDELRLGLQLSVDPVRGAAPSGVTGALGTGRVNLARLFTVLATLLQSSEEPAPMATPDPAPVPVAVPAKTLLPPLAFGAPRGSKPIIAVLRGGQSSSWLAYAEGFTGGVDVAIGQLDASAGLEIITVPGAGGGPHVRMFNEIGALVGQFFAFDASVTTGLQVATGDIDGDGVDEITVASGGVQPRARFFTGAGTLIREITLQGVTGDPRIAMGDMNGDGKDELIVSSSMGTPTVFIYRADGTRLGQFLAYGELMHKGVFVTTVAQGDRDVIVTGTGVGAGPHVRIFNGIGALVGQYFAGDAAAREGVRVAGWRTQAGVPVIVSAGFELGHAAIRLHTVDGTQTQTLSAPMDGRVTIGSHNSL